MLGVAPPPPHAGTHSVSWLLDLSGDGHRRSPNMRIWRMAGTEARRLIGKVPWGAARSHGEALRASSHECFPTPKVARLADLFSAFRCSQHLFQDKARTGNRPPPTLGRDRPPP